MYRRSPVEKRLRQKGKGKVWCFTGYDWQGRRYETSTGKYDRAEAIVRAREIEAERAKAPAPVALQKLGTLADAVALLAAHDKRVGAKPNTIRFHEDRAAHLVRLLGASCLLADECVNVPVLNRYTDLRLTERADRHTIQKEHRVLRQMIGLAREDGITTIDPSTLKVRGFINERHFYTPGDRWLRSQEQVQALLDELTEDRRDDVQAIVHVGVRRRELLTFTRSRVDLKKCFLTVRRFKDVTVKTEQANRQIPLNKTACEIFTRRCAAARAGVPLFSEWGSGNRDLSAAWERAREKLVASSPDLDEELPTSLCFNDLRRTFCSLLRAKGATFEECADLLGHEDITMVRQVYGHTDLKALRSVVELLD